MKKYIEKLALYYIQSDLKNFSKPTPTFIKSGFYLIKLTLSDGSYSLGEPHPYSGNKRQFINVIKKIFKFIKKKELNYLNLSTIKKKRNLNINKLCMSSCLAAIDSSIQNIKNKSNINFKSKKIISPNLYASGGMIFEDQNTKLLVDEMLTCKKMKFKGWKFRPPSPRSFKNHNQRLKSPDFIDVKKLIKICELMRINAGKDFDLMLDVGCRCKNFKDAKYLLEGIYDLNFSFIEEPVKRNFQIYKRIKKIKNKPKIAFGEHFSTLKDINYVFSKKLLDIFQPDTNLLLQQELKTIVKKASKYDIEIIPHNWFNLVNFQSNLSFLDLLKKKNKSIEFNILKNPYNHLFINNAFFVNGSKISIKNKNYQGIEYDFKKFEKFKIYES